MTELKTLKDLRYVGMVTYAAKLLPTSTLDEKKAIFTNVEELRQEGIKWLKEFQQERTDAISEMFDNVDENGIYPTTKFFNRIDDFWKNKFNITGEELK